MGSRARIAAAACMVASGLLVGGMAAPTSLADPSSATNDESAGGRADQPTQPHRAQGAGKRPERGEDDPPPGPTDDTGVEPGDGTPKDPEPGDDDPPREDPDGTPPTEGEEGGGQDVGGEEGEEKPRPPCCEKGDEDCGPGWPWPWPWPPDPSEPPPTDNSDNDSDRPPVGVPPLMPRPPLVGGPESPEIIDILPGIDIGATDVRTAPISVPVLVPAPVPVAPAVVPGIGPAVGPGAGPAPGAPSSGMPVGPRQVSTSPPPAQQPLPASAGTNVAMPASGSRAGYGEYLRSAGISQIAVLALPGLAGILVLTGAGGLLGYRQAKAGQGVRSSGIARFMN